MIEFFKENEFKETAIGEIPKDWDIRNLKDIITSCQNGVWGDDPQPNGESSPVIRSTEITHDGKIDLSTVAFRKIAKEEIDKYRLRDNDILIVGSSGSAHLIGRTALFLSPDNEKYLFSNFMVRIRPKSPDAKFLYYFLNSGYYFGFLRSLQQTSTGLRNLPKKEFLQLNVPFPPLPEQQKIAEILSTIDEAIQKTNEIIAVNERIKKGLMQELLTKGIGHKEFKYSEELGCEIPKEWEVKQLGDKETVKIILGQSPPSSSYNENGNGLPFLQGKAEFGYIYPNPVKYTTKPFKIAEKGDILISVRAPVGDVNLAPFKLCMGRGLTAIRFLTDNNLFYFYWFQKMKNFIENLGKGSTFKAITKDELENLFIPIPPLPEQQKIAEILSIIDKKQGLERNEKARLEKIKRGLMDLLLTGKIRVKVT